MRKILKRPRDPAQLAKLMIDIASGDVVDEAPARDNSGKNPHAVALGTLGGEKGGRARAAKLTAAQRREIAQKAAVTRWANKAKKES